MKRWLCLLLATFLLLMSGCATPHNSSRTIVKFYYKTSPVEYLSESGVITIEERITSIPATDYPALVEQYLNGARNTNCISPFPAGTTLKDLSISGDVATVVLSPHLSILTGSELTVACVCLAKTVFDMAQVETIQISAQNNLLNNEPYITIKNNDYILSDITINLAEDN